jgi:hypothetical protein
MSDGCGKNVVVFNKKLYAKKDIFEIAKYELGCEDDEGLDFTVFESVIQYGFYSTEEGELRNGWNIKDLYEPTKKTQKNQIEVWVVGVKEVR